jgi:hypothetical protein
MKKLKISGVFIFLGICLWTNNAAALISGNQNRDDIINYQCGNNSFVSYDNDYEVIDAGSCSQDLSPDTWGELADNLQNEANEFPPFYVAEFSGENLPISCDTSGFNFDICTSDPAFIRLKFFTIGEPLYENTIEAQSLLTQLSRAVCCSGALTVFSIVGALIGLGMLILYTKKYLSRKV